MSVRIASCFVISALCIALAPCHASEPPISTTEPGSVGRQSWNHGLVIDAHPDADGVTIRAVTPEQAGEHLGLRTGDRILAVNGHALRAPTSRVDFEKAIASSGGRVVVDVSRGGVNLRRSGVLDERAEVAGTCAWVTGSGSPPRNTDGIFNTEIAMIDGRATPLFQLNRHALQAGRRVLVVAELIGDDYFLTDRQIEQRSAARDRLRARANKVIVVDVAPGHSYHVGARMKRDRLSMSGIYHNDYWEPVVWKTEAAACP